MSSIVLAEQPDCPPICSEKSRRDGERNLASHSFQTAYMIAGLVTSMKSVEVAFAEVLIVDVVPQQVVSGDELADR